MNIMSLLIIVVVGLLGLLVAAGVVSLIVLAGREERGDLVSAIVIGGAAVVGVFCLVVVVAGVAVFFFGANVLVSPPPLAITPTPPPLALRPTGAPHIPQATVLLKPERTTIEPGESIQVTIAVEDVTNLYGIEVHLTYSGGLAVENLTEGACAAEYIAQSGVGDGRIDFAATRLPPAEPVTGDCQVASFSLTGVESGTYTLAFDAVLISTHEGEAIPVTAVDQEITVQAADF